MDLTFFNPNSQKESDFLAGFVARRSTLDFFLSQLRLVQAGRPARHHLIVAPRGFGKTALLRRIAIGVRTDADLHSRFIALRFREEQHNVISLDALWRNCIQSLLEAREDEGAPQDELDELDAEWTAHAPRQGLARDEQDGEPAWQALHARCEGLNRRPLLLIDNLDTLLAGLSSHHQWGLRKRLQGDDGPVLVAAASRYPESTHDKDAAFYEFFRIQPLDKLDNEEVFTCLRNIAGHRGSAGQQVLTLLDTDPGRVAALNALAGGNPRTLSVLYSVLESHMSGDVLSQLSAMLDTFTGWYQARTEELPMQARAVFDALALNWDPMTAAALGQTTGLDTPAVSSQLARLEKAGYVEPVALSKRRKGRSGYQVSERFFNIWYLMRNGPRRAKQSIRFLTTFLQSCFSSTERESLALTALSDRECDPGYSLALASSLNNRRLRQRLVEQAHVRSNEAGQANEYIALVHELRSEWRRGRKVSQADGGLTGTEADRGGDYLTVDRGGLVNLTQREQVARALVNKGVTLGTLGRSEHEIEVYDEVVARFGAATEPALCEQVARALVNKGFRLGTLGRSEPAIEVYDEVVARFGAATEPALRVQVGNAQVLKARLLIKLNHLDASESAYREAIRWQPTMVNAHNGLGNLLLDFKGDPANARVAYENGLAIATKPGDRAMVHSNLAYLFALHGRDPHGARNHASSALTDETSVSPAGRRLLQALHILSDPSAPDWRLIFNSIGDAVASEDPALWTRYEDDLQRLLWFVITKGRGADFKRWMEDAQYQIRYAPLYHAVVAALEGEDHLLQINPETRTPATKIYVGIARLLKLYGTGGSGKSSRPA